MSSTHDTVIVSFMMNYEKQMLIISVKMNQHCTICQMSLCTQENFEEVWSLWMHQFIIAQISKQKEENVSETDNVWVYSVNNFAWSHYLINIHEMMMIGVLHQLLKKMITYMICWLKQLIEKSVLISKKKKKVRHIILNTFRSI